MKADGERSLRRT